MTRLKVLFVSIVLFALLGMLLHESYKRKELERSIMYLCDGFAYSPLRYDGTKNRIYCENCKVGL